MELLNLTDGDIDLSGWLLTDGNDLQIQLRGSIPANSFFLLERTDDNTIASMTADQVYTGNLRNTGEELLLLDPSGSIVDSANHGGGPWPCGDSAARASMERLGGEDQPGNWMTFPGWGGVGFDSAGHAIRGTPRQHSAIFFATPTPSMTPSPGPHYPPQYIYINEIAWSGTIASSSDEWIELFNPNASPVNLTDWSLSDGGDIAIKLEGSIAAHSFFLLERTDDSSIDNIAADQIYSGNLNNRGEQLMLRDPYGALVDSADGSNGWPAGDGKNHRSMERRGGEDRRGNWGTFTGWGGNGYDAGGKAIQGTPRQPNSVLFPTPEPTWIPGKVVINEVLIRPHYDWEGTGGIDTKDEFIELLNLGPNPVNLRGWWLDDIADGGSSPYKLPGVTLKPGEFAVFFRTRTRIALNDGGDSVRLLSPDQRVIDHISYKRVRAYNLSYGRLPDGSGHLLYGLWPTAGEPNLLFLENVSTDQDMDTPYLCLPGEPPRLRFPRLGRNPGMVSRLMSQGHVLCTDRPSHAAH
jgi:hypothetical protein